MNDPLELLLADGVIDEISARLKSGKEADLWLVRHGGHTVAAKVYKARHARSFRNNAGYKEGRQVRDTRTQRAMDRGSRFGQQAAEDAWKAKEADALHALHAAGVRVPTPVMFYEGVLLMELVVDAHGHPAPRLVDAHVAREHAAELYADLRGQAVRMLGCHLIHGDLSPYNILLGTHGPVVIDFPQVVGAAHNSQAESYFLRDLENVRRFLAAIDPALHARSGDAREIWRAYVRGELTPEFVPSGRIPERTGGQRSRGEGRERAPSHAAGGDRKRDHGHQDRRSGQQDRGHGPQERGTGSHARGHEQREGGHDRPERGRGHQDRRAGQQDRGHGRQERGAAHPARGHEHGEPERAHAQERGAEHRDRARGHQGRGLEQQDRRTHPARGRPPPGNAAGAAPRAPGSDAAGQHRRTRHPAPPVPEVVRIVRPPFGSAAAATNPGHRGASGAPPAQGTPPPASRPRRRRGGRTQRR